MERELDWIDLPNEDYTQVLGYTTPGSVRLNELLKSYNLLPKGREDSLIPRIDLLAQVEAWINNWINGQLSGVEKTKHLLWVSEIASKKRRYLEALKALLGENLKSIEALKKQGAKYIKVSVREENEPAQRLYKKFGFKNEASDHGFYFYRLDF